MLFSPKINFRDFCKDCGKIRCVCICSITVFYIYVSMSSEVHGISCRSVFVLNLHSETIPPILYSVEL